MADFNRLSGQASGQFIDVDNTAFVNVHTAGASKEDIRIIVTNEGGSDDTIELKIDTLGDTGTAPVKTVNCPSNTPFVIFDGVLDASGQIWMKSGANNFTVEGKVKTF